MSELNKILYERLRQTASDSSVRNSLPVLFFGNLFKARAVTIGLNPSDQEYLSKNGDELDGLNRRFESLGSLDAIDLASLTDEQCARAIQTMCDYYKLGKPVYSWFRSLDRVTQAMGFRYDLGEVAHLDLLQEATNPTWSKLSRIAPTEFDKLRVQDLPFLRWQFESFPVRTIICNGRTVFNEVCRLINGQVVKEGKLCLINWYVGHATTNGRVIQLVGWNRPLARPTGLGSEGEKELGQILSQELSLPS